MLLRAVSKSTNFPSFQNVRLKKNILILISENNIKYLTLEAAVADELFECIWPFCGVDA